MLAMSDPATLALAFVPFVPALDPLASGAKATSAGSGSLAGEASSDV